MPMFFALLHIKMKKDSFFLLTIHTLFGIISLKIEREYMEKIIIGKYIKEFLEKYKPLHVLVLN